jgi:predicted Zn-dependent protease
VGVYSGGGIHRGFASSFGQRSWFSTHSFQLDWSLVHSADKAVKTGYGGFSWSEADFEARYGAALERLRILSRPPRTITPGAYRAFLTPAAVQEIIHTLCWGGFGLRAVETKQTTFLRLIQGEASLSPMVSIAENTGAGVAPGFQEDGFIKPDRVQMIAEGRWKAPLVSPRSSREYGQPTNGCGPEEMPQSIDMAGGDLADSDVLERLGTGLYIGNLWYLNFSDRANGRITGMTRFATLWVENGQIVAPVNVMRFDETIYRVLGENLEALTAKRDFILSSDTYFRRSTDSARLPGALLRDFTFTL